MQREANGSMCGGRVEILSSMLAGRRVAGFGRSSLLNRVAKKLKLAAPEGGGVQDRTARRRYNV
jgi:hypothetical protein